MPKQLKLLQVKKDYTSIVKKHERLPSLPGLIMIAGPPASGKSFLCSNLAFNLYNDDDKHIFFKRVIWISPTVWDDGGLKGVRDLANNEDNDKIEIQLLPPRGENLNLEIVIDEVINYLKDMRDEDKENGIHTILIIDDSMSRMERQITSNLVKLCSTYRHISPYLTVVLCCQTYKGTPKPVREMASCIIVTGAAGKTRGEIIEDMQPIYGNEFENIFDHVLSKKYNFLYIDQRDQKIFKNFDNLIFSKY